MNNIIYRILRIWWFLISRIFRIFVPIKNNRVIMWAYSYRRYTCHPQHFTEYLLNSHPNEFEIIWAFENPNKNCVDSKIKVVKFPSFKYLWYLYSSKFVISNSRSRKFLNLFKRRNNQEYIQTWHDSGIALKRIEKDATSLSISYVKDAILDSKNCTLMLSGSQFQTNLIKKSFWYTGEILEKGLPRNDCLKNSNRKFIKDKVRKLYNIPTDKRIVLYAPTFRNDASEDKVFISDWNYIFDSLGNICVLVRLHPNSIKNIDIINIMTHGFMYNATDYYDMQELLIAADLLITDYSSCMIDMALQSKPCFLYAPDWDTYDRGYYFDLRQLPFSLSTTIEELIKYIDNFDEGRYLQELNFFLSNIVGFFQLGNSCESVYEWMKKKQ